MSIVLGTLYVMCCDILPFVAVSYSSVPIIFDKKRKKQNRNNTHRIQAIIRLYIKWRN